MDRNGSGALRLSAVVEPWPLASPVRIASGVIARVDLLVVAAARGGFIGQGEATGVPYRGETAASMHQAVEALVAEGTAGLDRQALPARLPAGGARNAIDCALWDLEAQEAGVPVWTLAGLSPPQPLETAFTLSAGSPHAMAAAALQRKEASLLKLKLLGDGLDAARVAAVRRARTDARLIVDANQSLTAASLRALMPALMDAAIALLEQPFPADQDVWLDGLQSPIPLAADESAQDRTDLRAMVGRVQVINIKLDKCGGLTEALAMAGKARALGFELMVGNMIGTSLAMEPGVILGQLCDLADLDGAMAFARDRDPPVDYARGAIAGSGCGWGSVRRAGVAP